jgi:hypothetical protein
MDMPMLLTSIRYLNRSLQALEIQYLGASRAAVSHALPFAYRHYAHVLITALGKQAFECLTLCMHYFESTAISPLRHFSSEVGALTLIFHLPPCTNIFILVYQVEVMNMCFPSCSL